MHIRDAFTLILVMNILCGVGVNKLGLQTIVSEFDYHKVSHTSDLV